jgi:hypothetical protein
MTEPTHIVRLPDPSPSEIFIEDLDLTAYLELPKPNRIHAFVQQIDRTIIPIG